MILYVDKKYCIFKIFILNFCEEIEFINCLSWVFWYVNFVIVFDKDVFVC